MANRKINLKASAALSASVLALGLGFYAPSAGAAGGGCANAGTNIENLSKQDAAKAVKCLFNQERNNSVTKNGDLTEVAQKHTNVMRSQDCFSHQCPGEDGFGKRVRKSGYLDGATNARVAEIIAFGNDKSANDIVDKWLDNSEHRALINRESFEDVGVGVNTQGGNVLVTAVLGHR